MKAIKIFWNDLKNNLRSFLTLWIIIIPVVLAAIIQAAAPGITNSFLNIALLEDSSPEKISFYEKYASVEVFDTAAQAQKRIMGRDFCCGVLPDDAGGYQIVSQGNEPRTVIDAVKLLKTYEENEKSPVENVVFSDLGRTTPPLKSILITGLLLLVTILSGMLIALDIVEEKSDKTIRAIRVAPVSTTDFVVGKSLIGIVYTLVNGFVILCISGYWDRNILQILMVLLASSFISFVIGFLVGLTSDDFIAAAGNMKLIILPAIVPVLVTELANAKFHFLVWWSPFYWSYRAMKSLLNQTATTGSVLADCGIVSGIAVVIYILLLPNIRRKLK